tara:strand:+ start:507 stop:683 length:177 start_codon:yes stop_codon:yes gene_type:complete
MCKHLKEETKEQEIYCIFVEADQCCIDVCEPCFMDSNVIEKISPNSESSYMSLYNEWI